MTETAQSLWGALDLEINDYIGDGADAYCLTDKIVQENIRDVYPHCKIANMIGLKRRIGKVLAKRGYTKTSTSPPMWVLHPLPKPEDLIMCRCSLPGATPQWVIDQYLTLHQGIAIIEREYPDIVRVAGGS